MNTSRQNLHLHKIKQAIYLVLSVSLLTSLFPSALALADSNQLYVTPQASQMSINTSLPVNIKAYASSDSPGNVNGTITYPANLLQVTSISVSGSSYGSPTITQGSGTIGFSGTGNTNTGLAQIFSITFKTTAAGKATVAFSGDSQVNGTATTHKSGVFTIINPNPNPPKKSSSPSPPKKTPSPSPVPIISTEPTAPTTIVTPSPQISPDPSGVISGVVITPTYSSTAITWTVNAPHPSSTLNYGDSSSGLVKQATVQKKSGGAFTATISGLSPGVTYYFSITGEGKGIQPGSYSESFTTQGYPVIINITENDSPVDSAQVQIGSQNFQANKGKLPVGLAAGSYSGTITTDTATLTINLTVAEKPIPADGSAPESQSFAFNMTSSPLKGGPGSSFSIFAFVGILIGGTALLALAFLLYVNYRRHQFESGSFSTAPSSTVVIDDGYNWHQDESAQSPTQQPTSPAPPIEQPPPEMPRTVHANSVYITEEEPLDMFDQAKITLPPTTGPSTPPSDEMPQNPNPLHSTKP